MMKDESKLISTIWNEREKSTARTINPPLQKGSTVLFDCYEDMVKRGEYDSINYGTDRLPIQRQFEEAMRQLEGASITRLMQSGISAIQTALMAFTKAGDHILVCDNAYGPGQHFCRTILRKFGVESTFIPPNIGANIDSYFKDNTVLVLLESPGSITFELQDIPAISAIAKEKDIITILDNTWATPLNLKAFELGVDVTIHAVSKYISGYSDVLAGSVSVNEKHHKSFEKFYKTMEIYTPAEESYLSLRGLHSLVPRLKHHEQSALRVAHWLQDHPLVADVLHPALPSHPEHHIWKRDFTGATGLFSIVLKDEWGEQKLARFIDTLELFHLGYSWGGYKSLLTAAKVNRSTPCRYNNKTIIRLSIGLEDCDDLLNDLEKGLNMLK